MRFAGALAAVAWAACAAHAVRVGTTGTDAELQLEDAVGGPYRLVAAVMLVDGEVVARSAGTVHLHLAPGPHEVAMAARITRPCQPAADTVEVTRVRAAHAFTVGDRQPLVEARIAAGPLTAPALNAFVDGTAFSASVSEPGCCSLELTEAPWPQPVSTQPALDCNASPGATAEAVVSGVLVTGEVQRPREVAWSKGMTAYDAIAAAGGVTRLANLRYTQVERRCGDRLTVLELPWYASASSLELKPGDNVIVQMTPEP